MSAITGKVEIVGATGNQALVNADGQLAVLVEGIDLNPSDINIGSVEIKDAVADIHVNIKNDGIDNGMVVIENPSVTLYDGNQATSGTAAALNGGVSQSVKEVIVTNTDTLINLLVGNATSQSTPLKPGTSITIKVNNLNKVYVKSASGVPVVAWLGRS